MKYVVGIDEAGRGPLAGPVAVGAVAVLRPEESSHAMKHFFKGIKDSKKLSKDERELWFDMAVEARRRGELDFAVALVSEKIIDKHGISYAIRLGIKRVLKKLGMNAGDAQIFLDGGLKAPLEFEHQLTVIKGDEKIPIVSLASIVAKVTRDRRMSNLSKRFPEFDFETHKGYGTKAHRDAILKYGLTELHRRTFVRRLTQG